MTFYFLLKAYLTELKDNIELKASYFFLFFS